MITSFPEATYGSLSQPLKIQFTVSLTVSLSTQATSLHIVSLHIGQAMASPAMGYVPPSTSNNFIFSSL